MNFDRKILEKWNSVLMDLEGAETGFCLNTFMGLDDLGISEEIQDKVANLILSVLEKTPVHNSLLSYERSNNEGSLVYIAINGASITEDVLIENAYCDEIMGLENDEQAQLFCTQLIVFVSAMWNSMKELESLVLKYYLEE